MNAKAHDWSVWADRATRGGGVLPCRQCKMMNRLGGVPAVENAAIIRMKATCAAWTRPRDLSRLTEARHPFLKERGRVDVGRSHSSADVSPAKDVKPLPPSIRGIGVPG